MRPWEAVIPEEDRAIYSQAGYGAKQQLGRKVALLVIDVVESFTGSKPQQVSDSIKEYKTSCGEVAWQTLPRIKTLIDCFRSNDLTVVYTTGDPVSKVFAGNSTKGSLHNKPEETIRLHSTKIPDIVAPLENEYVLRKTKASVFFGTPLASYFTRIGVDTLFVTGTTTCGCIRASVVDAYSHGFGVFVVEDCCFDRSMFSHQVNLFEMNQKYADVITLESALGMIGEKFAKC